MWGKAAPPAVATDLLSPGDRVRGIWDLATVFEVIDDLHVVVQFDAVDATGTRVDPWFCEPRIRSIRTLTKMPKDTPQAEERP